MQIYFGVNVEAEDLCVGIFQSYPWAVTPGLSQENIHLTTQSSPMVASAPIEGTGPGILSFTKSVGITAPYAQNSPSYLE